MQWEVKNMSMCNCRPRCGCILAVIVAALILGVVAAFLQITGVITVTAAFLWVALGIAVVYLAVLTVAAALRQRPDRCECGCDTLNAVLAGILATALLAVVLLAVGVTATSVVSAILVGLLVAGLALTIGGTACFVKCLAGCDD